MNPSNIFYGHKIAPKGALYLEKPTHSELGFGISDTDAARDIQRIGHQAYLNSMWIDALAVEHSLTSEELVLKIFNPDDRKKFLDQYRKVIRSDGILKSPVYWFGEHIEHHESSKPFDVKNFLPKGQPHGFVKVERQVSPGSIAKRLFKYATNHAYVTIHDLNVLPEASDRGLGTALVYNALREQPSWMPSSIYTPSGNKAVRYLADKYGYSLYGEDSIDIFGIGLDINTAVYRARRVGDVVSALEEQNNWLKLARN